MKKSEMKNMKKAQTLGIGTHDVTFKKFAWRTDKNDEVLGAFIHIEGYQPLYLNFFEENNYMFDYFLDQLGIDSYDEDTINECAPRTIKVTRYPNGNFINTSFNPNQSTDNTSAEARTASFA